MASRLRMLMKIVALAVPICLAIWTLSESAWQAAWWIAVIAFFVLCYWVIRRAQIVAKGSYRYSDFDSGAGGEGGV